MGLWTGAELVPWAYFADALMQVARWLRDECLSIRMDNDRRRWQRIGGQVDRGGYKMHMGDPLLPQITGGGHYKFGGFKMFDYDRSGRQGDGWSKICGAW